MWLEPNARNGNSVALQDLEWRSSDNRGPLLFVPLLGFVLISTLYIFWRRYTA
jgi:hypothetical protein